MSGETHREHEGKLYLRTTAVLDAWIEPWMVEWKLDIGRVKAYQTSRKSLKIGSRVDELVMNSINDKDWKLRKTDGKEVASCMRGYQRFIEQESFKPVKTQQTYYDADTMTCGTLDVECEDAILDIKTSQQISAKYWLQVAWYNHLSRLNKPNLSILRVDKFWETYQYQVRPMNTAYLDIFRGILGAYRYFEQKGEVR